VVENGTMAVLALVLIFGAATQVILRLFDIGVIWLDPVLRALVMWIAMLGAVAATRHDKHINLDALTRLLEDAQKVSDNQEENSGAFFKKLLLQQLGIIRLVANTPTSQNQALLKLISGIGNKEIPVEGLLAWADLYPVIDKLYDGFYSRMMEKFGQVLSDKEVQICCLLCAGFSTKEIGVVTDKEGEVAILRTMGMSESGIVKIFMVLGASSGVIGALFGGLAGLALCFGLNPLLNALGLNLYMAAGGSGLPVIVEPAQVMTILLGAVLLSFSATLYPASRAARVKPAEALRYE
jgi:hypothetical protein